MSNDNATNPVTLAIRLARNGVQTVRKRSAAFIRDITQQVEQCAIMHDYAWTTVSKAVGDAVVTELTIDKHLVAKVTVALAPAHMAQEWAEDRDLSDRVLYRVCSCSYGTETLVISTGDSNAAIQVVYRLVGEAIVRHQTLDEDPV